MATGQALERARPQEQALIQVATELGVVRYAEGGGMMIDLTGAALREKYNVLAPAATIAKGDPNFTPSLSVVELSPDYENGGDFYPLETSGSGQNKTVKSLALTKKALDQIAQKAGIEDLGPEIVHWGPRAENVRVTWRAQIRTQDGWNKRDLFGSQEWVEEAEMALLKSNPPEWATKSDSAYNEWWAKNWWGRVHKFRIRMTETKARLAAYRQALTVKQKYLPSEVTKPFLVATLTYTPDTSDPTVLRMLMNQGQKAAGLLYGERSGPMDLDYADAIDADDHPLHHAKEREDPPAGVDTETGEVIDGEAVEEPETHGAKPTEDLKIPRGPHAGRMLSELAKEDPAYTQKTFAGNEQWGPVEEQWRLYWHGEEDGLDGLQF